MKFLVICVSCILFGMSWGQRYFQPEQLHLSYPNNPTTMYVTWSTRDDPLLSICQYGTVNLNNTAIGYRTIFVDGGPERRAQIIHRVTLLHLVPGVTYWYHCGSHLGWSELFFFRALRSGVDWSPKFAIFGDLGNENAMSLPFLQEETQRGDYDVILHVGDFAYDMDTKNGQVGDEFMRQIEPIAAYCPYMVCVGNHENQYNFSNYKNRFTMPKTTDNMFFSFDVGPVHFISISTEFYFYTSYGMKQIANQYEWLENDLKEANLPENRSQRPWIVTYGHRPMYCSNNDGDDCSLKESVIRIGLPVLHWYGLEKLFYNHGVDLAIWAHEHSYERMWPVYDLKVVNGSNSDPYTDPKATVHVTTGSAGCHERHDDFQKESPPWTAFRTTDYGYSRMQAINSSHLYFEQVSVDKSGSIIDNFTIIKQQHGSY